MFFIRCSKKLSVGRWNDSNYQIYLGNKMKWFGTYLQTLVLTCTFYACFAYVTFSIRKIINEYCVCHKAYVEIYTNVNLDLGGRCFLE